MEEIEVVKKYYEKIVKENFKNSGELKNPDIFIKAVNAKGCHGNNTNLLYFYLRIEKKVVKDIKYECEYCDLMMYVVGESMCNLLKYFDIDRILDISEKDFFAELGGYSYKALFRWKTALDILCKNIRR